MKDTKWYEFKDFKDMTPEQQEEYKKCKGEIITNYLGVSTSDSSLRLRTQAYLEETKTGFWD
jgi:hypothetical protein